MKSKYFKQYSLSDDAKKHLTILSNLPADALNVICSWFEQVDKYPRFDGAEIKALSEKTGLGADPLRKAISITDTLLKRMGELKDSAEDIISDIVSLQILAGASQNLSIFLNKLSLSAEKYFYLYRKHLVTKWGLSYLSGSSMSVAIKPVFANDFNYGLDNIASFEPILIGTNTVANISLTKSDCSQEFAFQLSKEDLDRFITDLIVLQKQMVLAEESKNKLA